MTKKKITNENPISHIPLPFDEVIGDVLKIKPPPKSKRVAQKTEQQETNDQN